MQVDLTKLNQKILLCEWSRYAQSFFYDHNECQFAQSLPTMMRVLIVLKVQVRKNISAHKEENKHHINNLFV